MEPSLKTEAQKIQCDQIPRATFSSFKADKDFEDTLRNEVRVLPLYETKIYELAGLHQYSLVTNERMACEWRKKMSLTTGKDHRRTMRQFPDISDYHFYNYCNRFLPSLSRKHAPPPRLTLTPGPGTDKFGQKPIPVDMLLRKSKAIPIHPKPKNAHLKKCITKPKKH